MFQSFFVYSFIGFCLFVLGTIANKKQLSNNSMEVCTPFWTFEIVASIMLFAFISGVRWNVGVDYLAYLDNYLKIQYSGYTNFEKELGFDFLTNLLAGSGVHFSVYFGLLAFLQIFFIYKTFSNERYLFPFLGLMVLFGPEYLSWMNGMRQMLVATAFVWSIPFIRKRQFLNYFIFVAIASLFHKSATMLLIFYFIPNKDYFKNRMLTLGLVVATLYLGNNNFWIDSLKNLGTLLDFIGYNKYSEGIVTLIEEEQLRNIGPRRLVIILVALITIWFSPQLKERFAATNFLSYYNLAVLGFLLYNLLGNTHHIFIRPIGYLTIFSVVTSSYLLAYLKEISTKGYLAFFLVFLTCLAYMPLSIVTQNGKGSKDYTNYKFFWDYSL